MVGADVFALIVLLVSAGAVIFYFAARKNIRALLSAQAERDSSVSGATPAQATILSFESLRRAPFALLDLNVHRKNQPPYRATVVWRVEVAGEPYVQVGMRIPVKIDARDTSIVYPDVPAVTYEGKVDTDAG